MARRTVGVLFLQLLTVLGHDLACGEAHLPQGCCMLVTIIVAKRCHCLMPLPKQARCLLCSVPLPHLPAAPVLLQMPVSKLILFLHAHAKARAMHACEISPKMQKVS